MSPPRCPVPRPPAHRSKGISRAREFSPCRPGGSGASPQALFSSASSPYPALPRDFPSRNCAQTQTDARTNHCEFFMETPRREIGLLLRDLQQIFQLAHELLHVLEVHVHRANRTYATLSSFFSRCMIISPISVVVSSRSVDSCTTPSIYRRSLRVSAVATGRFSQLQESLQDFLPLETLAPAVLLDDHVRNFVDSFVGCESPAALQALAPAANGVSDAAFPRINHLVVNVRAKKDTSLG